MRCAWLLVVVVSCRCNDSNREVAATLDGLRWEIPCKPGHTGPFCSAAVDKPTKSARLGGDPNTMYDVTLRFRGVVEQESYEGGRAEGMWYVGGHHLDGLYNIYELETSAPPQVFFLNAAKGPGGVLLLDYRKTIRVQGGATVTLSADAQDGKLVANLDEKGKPIVVDGVAPAPSPFDGQFIQMDVESVTRAN